MELRVDAMTGGAASGATPKRKVYLAGPGRRVGFIESVRYRRKIGGLLRHLGFVVVDPYQALIDSITDPAVVDDPNAGLPEQEEVLAAAIRAAGCHDPYFRLLAEKLVAGGLKSLQSKRFVDVSSDAERRMIEQLDAGRVAACDILVAHLPVESPGTIREAAVARAIGILRFAFGSAARLPGVREAFDAAYASVDELVPVLDFYLSGERNYLTTASVHGARGQILLYAVDLCTSAPHRLVELCDQISTPRALYSFCCERSHVHELAQKLPLILRLGRVDGLSIVTRDGSPHDVQMHTLAQEVVENVAYAGQVRHFVVERGVMHEVSAEAVRGSRHLWEVQSRIMSSARGEANRRPASSAAQAARPHVAVLVGGKDDLPCVEEAGIDALLAGANVASSIETISSDREPELLRQRCRGDGRYWDLVIAIAGGVPNLPIAVKSWLPATPVIGVSVDEGLEATALSLSTPSSRPVIVAGHGVRGLRKACNLAIELLRWRGPKRVSTQTGEGAAIRAAQSEEHLNGQ